MRVGKPLTFLATAVVAATVAIAPAVAGDLIGTVGSPTTHITFSDGSSVDVSVSGSNLSTAVSSRCMRNDGSGSCNWGGSPSAVDFSGVYTPDGVKDVLGSGVSIGGSTLHTLCDPYMTLNGSGEVVQGALAYCNNGNSVGTITFTFSQPTTDVTLDVHNIGGSSGSNWGVGTTHTWDEWVVFWPTYQLQTAGVTMSTVSSRGNFQVSGTTLGLQQDLGTGVDPRTDYGVVWAYPLPYAGYTIAGVSDPSTRYTMGSGSVRLTSATPFTSLTFAVDYKFKVLDYGYDGTSYASPLSPSNLYIAGDTTEFLVSIAQTTSSGGDSAGPTVGPARPAIAASDSSYTTPYNTPITVPADIGALANDSGYAIQQAQYGQPEHGTLVMEPNGSFTYTPNEGFSGTDCAPYVIADPYGQSARAQVCVTVPAPEVTEVVMPARPSSDPTTTGAAVPSDSEPLATPRSKPVPAGSVKPVWFSPNGSSKASSGSRLTTGHEAIAVVGTNRWVKKLVAPGKGAWEVVGGRVKFTPVRGFHGKSVIRYRVLDANGKYAMSTFTVSTADVPSTINGGS